MRFAYRCSKCRARNTFPRKVEEYIIARKCKSCGYKRFYVDKERMRRKSCYCSGYWFPHRIGCRCCVQNKDHVINSAIRAGATADELLDLRLDLLWEADGGRVMTEDEAVPF